MTKTVALYLRVSTDDQTVENQRQALTEACDRRGWRVAAEYVDAGISGAKGRGDRPGFDRLHKAIVRGKFDIVAAWSVDRLGRSLQDLVSFLGELHSAGVGLYLDRQGVDTTTPAGRALFQMLGVFAEFERSIIVERVRAGLARARERGTKSGRPIGGRALAPAMLEACRVSLANGASIRVAAAAAGISVGKAHQVSEAMKAATELLQAD